MSSSLSSRPARRWLAFELYLPPLDGICDAASAPDPHLLATAYVDRTVRIERHLQFRQCAAATSTSSRLERIRPSMEQYRYNGHGGTMNGRTKGLHASFFVLQEGPGARRLVHRRRAHRPELDHGPDRHRSWFLPFTSKPFATVRMTASVWGLRVRGGAKHHHLDTQVAQRRRPEVDDAFEELTEEEFQQYFRRSKGTVRSLRDELDPSIGCQRASGLSTGRKVLCALRFFGTGNFQRSVGREQQIGMAQPAASNTIHEVTEAIISVSARESVLACVNGTLINVMKPEGLSPADTASFMSRKGYYALNVMVVCNSELCILVVDPRLPDSGHDSWVWQHNSLCARLAAQLQPGESLLATRGEAPSPFAHAGARFARSMMQVQANGEDISPEEFLAGNGCCTVSYKMQFNRETTQSNAQNGTHSRTGERANGNRQRSRQQQRNVKKQVIRNSKMSLLPRSDFKIVIPPRGGLAVATTRTVRLASAIYRAANSPVQEAGEDTVCSNNHQNIIVAAEEAEATAEAFSPAGKPRSRYRTHCRGRSQSRSRTPDPRQQQQRRARSRNPRRTPARDTETTEKKTPLSSRPHVGEKPTQEEDILCIVAARRYARTAAEDFTIVLKLRVTMDLKAAFQPGELGTMLASYLNATNSDCISVWPIWAQNIIDVSTNDINTANLLSREFSLKNSQGPLPMIGHAKISGEMCRGVIMVHEQEASAFLTAKIHWRGGNIAFIRKLGKTSVALLTYEGHHVPRFVQYNSAVTPVREYKRTILACYCCGAVGHRPKLCPHPNDQRCGHCGHVAGASEEGMTRHECKPSCLVCGEGHMPGLQGKISPPTAAGRPTWWPRLPTAVAKAHDI
ncbi:hypothetical protein HPB49_009070 [Dermacentor silvarum]|uniref:Uncharacterized protein n=1 Tax=Dermacentor silvarum TaxID=543639 RepID=A0ACB8CWU0_DERSI|nr:hypothetical protein HPB49_009070 [Dermacentor silvarum]